MRLLRRVDRAVARRSPREESSKRNPQHLINPSACLRAHSVCVPQRVKVCVNLVRLRACMCVFACVRACSYACSYARSYACVRARVRACEQRRPNTHAAWIAQRGTHQRGGVRHGMRQREVAEEDVIAARCSTIPESVLMGYEMVPDISQRSAAQHFASSCCRSAPGLTGGLSGLRRTPAVRRSAAGRSGASASTKYSRGT